MSEAKIGQDDVVTAAQALQVAGEPINPFRIRVKLGRSGYKTT